MGFVEFQLIVLNPIHLIAISVSVNVYGSGFAAINYGFHQGSVLGPLLFFLYINGLNQAIKLCKVHHFADETNLLCLSNSIKKLNKLVNVELVNANEISPRPKKLEGDLKIKLYGKRLYLTESVNLTWHHHVNDLSIKLSRARNILRSIYFTIFGSYLSY